MGESSIIKKRKALDKMSRAFRFIFERLHSKRELIFLKEIIMEGFIEVTNEELKKNIGKDWDGDILFYHDNIFYVRLDTGYVAIRDYDKDIQKEQEEPEIAESCTVL